jgi:hypothetical protein
MSNAQSPGDLPEPALAAFSDDELRAEARRRGYELHSKQFSESSQRLIRELPELRRRLEALEELARSVAPAKDQSFEPRPRTVALDDEP